MKKYLFLSLGIIWLLLVLGCQPLASEIEPTAGAGIEEAEEVEESDGSPTGAAISEKERVIVSNEVAILGRQGFNPEELKIIGGSKVIFTNTDSKTAVLNFQRGNSLRISISGSIPPGETYIHTFEEAGIYTCWTTGYGIKGKITVE